MRRYDETIDVRHGRVGSEEGPAQFLWRNKLWKVCDIQHRWSETADWWNGADVRAARGESGNPGDGDLLVEQEIWRVVAADGRTGYRGVYELGHRWNDGQWVLRGVVD